MFWSSSFVNHFMVIFSCSLHFKSVNFAKFQIKKKICENITGLQPYLNSWRLMVTINYFCIFNSHLIQLSPSLSIGINAVFISNLSHSAPILIQLVLLSISNWISFAYSISDYMKQTVNARTLVKHSTECSVTEIISLSIVLVETFFSLFNIYYWITKCLE